MKLWFTAAELADAVVAGLMEGLPRTQRGVQLLARRENWERYSALARLRAGRAGGGGLEYHIDVLPAPVRLGYLSRHVVVTASDARPAIPGEDVPLTGRGRQSRDARLVILSVADRYKQGNRLSAVASDGYFATLFNAGEVEIAPWVRGIVKRISGRTLARWRAARDRKGAAALAYDPALSRKDTGILSRAEEGAVRDFILGLLAKNPFSSTEHIRNTVIARFGPSLDVAGARRPVPGLRGFQFAIADLRRGFRNELTKLTDPDGYRSKVEFVATGTSTAHRLNEVWQIDASPLDAIMLSGKRQTIYVAIDVLSRRVMILLTPTPRAAAVGLLMRKCLIAWGVPERVKTDNGSDFTAHATERLMALLGIEVELAPPYTPRAKAIVERAIGTFQRDFAATLPGFVGHSVADRKVIEGRKAFSRRLGLDDAHLFDADMTEAEAAAYADSWAAEIYAHTPHGGLGGATPFAAAAAYAGPVRRIENLAALDILLAPVAGADGLRRVTKTGIRVDGANYLIGSVMPGTDVLCRMDPSDLGRLGDRVITNMAEHDYAIKNKDWELTVGVDRNHIMDDNLGIYAKRFEGIGKAVRAHKPRLAWGMLKLGFTTACYDGQNYFDEDHPVIAANGNVASVANTDGGGGAPWFLMDSRMLLKPILFQERKKPEFVYLDKPTDGPVFTKKKHVYGVDSRDNVGFGFWQGIWGSKQTLDPTNYAAARAALIGMTGDYGRPLGIMPDLLIVTGTNESAGRKIVINENASGGESNEWKGTARIVVSKWLAAA